MIEIPDFVYPKDQNGIALCPRCAKVIDECDCLLKEPKKAKLKTVKPNIRLDKSGRKGKVVTLISNLQRNEAYLKNLAKKLKTKTGSGGTFYLSQDGGIIEIQGDHVQVINNLFDSNFL